MTVEKRKVLIVDDNATEIHILVENLREEYATRVATNGSRAIELLRGGYQPDVILLDVVMPDLNGYDTCRQIMSMPSSHRADVIFVSGHDTVEEKLAGYEAGGSDYLIKPIVPDELTQKVRLAISNRIAREKLHIEIDSAVETAMTALSVSEHQGILVDFLRKCMTASTPEQIAQLAVSACNKFGIGCCIQVRCPWGKLEFSDEGSVSPVESELLSRLYNNDKSSAPKSICISHQGAISLLARHLPEESEKRSRLREYLGILCDSAAQRFDCLMQNTGVPHAADSLLVRFIHQQQHSVDEWLKESRQHKEKILHLFDGMTQHIERDFTSLGFSEKQEALLMSLLQEGAEQLAAHCEDGHALDERLQKLFDELKLYTH
jgi:DNA-binding response OmpR family regulator